MPTKKTTKKPVSKKSTTVRKSSVMQRFMLPRLDMILIVVLFAAIGGYFTLRSSASTSGAAAINIAERYLGVAENPNGSNRGGMINTFTDGHAEPWCADFVSWVYKQRGTPFTGGASGGWRIPAVVSLEAWFRKHGEWHTRTSGDTPQAGDVFRLNWSGRAQSVDNHTGLVVSVKGSTMYAIEGNRSNAVRKITYPNYKNDKRIIGWGRVKGSSNNIPSTNPISGGGRGTSKPITAPSPAPAAKPAVSQYDPSKCSGTPKISPGDRSHCVAKLQKLLSKRGYAVDAQGIYGSKTKASVIAFKKKVGLAADGEVRDNLWKKL